MKSSVLAAAATAAAGAPSIKHTTSSFHEDEGLLYFTLNATQVAEPSQFPLGLSTLSSKTAVSLEYSSYKWGNEQYFSVDHDYSATGVWHTGKDFDLEGLGKVSLSYIADNHKKRNYVKGVLGLGPPLANAKPEDSPVLSMHKAGMIPKPIIGIDIIRKEQCNITWGGIDIGQVEGDLAFFPKIGDEHWNLPFYAASLGNEEVMDASWSSVAAITTDYEEIQLEYPLYKAIKTALTKDLTNTYETSNGALYTTSSCKAAKKLMMDMTFRTLRYDIILTPDALPMADTNEGHCYLGIHSTEVDNFSSLGQVFLDSFYVGFDYEEEEIMLGVKKSAVGKVALKKVGEPPAKEDAPSDAQSDPVEPDHSDDFLVYTLRTEIEDLKAEVSTLKSEVVSWGDDSSGSGLRLTWCRQNPASSWLGVFLQSMRSGYPLLELWGCQLQVNPGLLWKLVAPLEDWKLATK